MVGHFAERGDARVIVPKSIEAKLLPPLFDRKMAAISERLLPKNIVSVLFFSFELG